MLSEEEKRIRRNKRNKEWRAKNREKWLEMNKKNAAKWRENHPDRYIESYKKRNAHVREVNKLKKEDEEMRRMQSTSGDGESK